MMDKELKILIELAKSGKLTKSQFKREVGKLARKRIAELAGYGSWKELIEALFESLSKEEDS